MKRICVFCGSHPGIRKEYGEMAGLLGTVLAHKGIGLVFGGGNVGLMDTVATAALAAGGEAIGVITQAFLDLDLAHQGVTELKVTSTMHERKALMAELSDGFIALPGGMGTLEELFEVLTWAQLGIHRKPCGVLDVLDYFHPIRQLLDRAVAEGFLMPEYGSLLITGRTPEELLNRFENDHSGVQGKYGGRKDD
jgi:uncharacterized protein (TIGR00730 family)